MAYYKIVEWDGGPKTLFHGVGGSRRIQPGWMEADKKMVRDGGHKWYMSGFHVFKSIEVCREYLKKFRKERELRVVEVLAENTRPKHDGGVYLADRIKLT